MTHRLVFMGTPDFAVPCLQTLIDYEGFAVIGVVTQPDRPAGRGRELRASPVKQRALGFELPVFQPQNLRSDEALEQLQAWHPDIVVVVAYGQILPNNVLEIPPYGCINVHASLLPRWRGAAPIQYAIRAGDSATGVTIMRMDEGLDTGPILAARSIPLAMDETAATLHDKLAELGAELLPQTLQAYIGGEFKPAVQADEGVTFAPTLSKEAGLIDWTTSAAEIDRQVRAYDPWPGTFTTMSGQRMKVISGAPLMDISTGQPPGKLLEVEGQLAVQTGAGIYVLHVVQPTGKKQMEVSAFMAGRQDTLGQILGVE